MRKLDEDGDEDAKCQEDETRRAPRHDAGSRAIFRTFRSRLAFARDQERRVLYARRVLSVYWKARSVQMLCVSLAAAI